MKNIMKLKIFLLSVCSAFSLNASAQMDHSKHKAAKVELGTSAAVDARGRLWVASKEPGVDQADYVVLQMSTDLGKTWSAPKRVQARAEPVAADGESRPKLAFGAKGEMYIAYTKPLARPYTGEIRFVRSLDGGQSFSPPVTVHANRDEITHRFESMIVDKTGRIFIAWIDKRDAEAARKRKEVYQGAAVYYAVSDDAGASFRGDYRLAEHSCECCRIGLALNPAGTPVALWRHVFEPNARDHALAELTADGKPSQAARATFDNWRVDACPHHGPSLAYSANGTRHQTWFNVVGDEGGVYYAAARPAGMLANVAGLLGTPVRLGNAQAEHADVMVSGATVVLVWKQFDGAATAIYSRVSRDDGATWQERKLASTTGNSDQPHLLHMPNGIALLWRTQQDGVQIIAIEAVSDAANPVANKITNQTVSQP
jgi:hypothetical protein